MVPAAKRRRARRRSSAWRSAAIRGAGLNVRINLPGLGDPALAATLRQEADALVAAAETEEQVVLALVEAQLKG